MFTTRFEAWVRRHAQALVSALGRSPLTPNQVSVVGVALTFLAATLVAFTPHFEQSVLIPKVDPPVMAM